MVAFRHLPPRKKFTERQSKACHWTAIVFDTATDHWLVWSNISLCGESDEPDNSIRMKTVPCCRNKRQGSFVERYCWIGNILSIFFCWFFVFSSTDQRSDQLLAWEYLWGIYKGRKSSSTTITSFADWPSHLSRHPRCCRSQELHEREGGVEGEKIDGQMRNDHSQTSRFR